MELVGGLHPNGMLVCWEKPKVTVQERKNNCTFCGEPVTTVLERRSDGMPTFVCDGCKRQALVDSRTDRAAYKEIGK